VEAAGKWFAGDLVALHRELKRKRWHSALLTNVATIKIQLLLAFELVEI